jgi:hypothetical protein
VAEDQAKEESGAGGAAGPTDTTGTLITGENWGMPLVQNIPQMPVRFATVSVERLAMLATVRRGKLGDFAWPAITGLCGSLPATIHNLIEAYWIDNPIGLSATRLIEVGVTLFFLAFTVAAMMRDRGQSANQLLEEILNPPPTLNAEACKVVSWSEIWSEICSKILS